MQTPDNSEGRLAEAIMMAIREHVRWEDPDGSHHYNRAYEKVYAVLRTVHCTRCSAGTFEIEEPTR